LSWLWMVSINDAKANAVMAAYIQGDYQSALREFRPLAEEENAVAQNNLGGMYYNGQGVAQDYVQAHMWFSLAAAQGNESARWNRDIVEEKMTPEQIAEARRLAREWKPKGEWPSGPVDTTIRIGPMPFPFGDVRTISCSSGAISLDFGRGQSVHGVGRNPGFLSLR